MKGTIVSREAEGTDTTENGIVNRETMCRVQRGRGENEEFRASSCDNHFEEG